MVVKVNFYRCGFFYSFITKHEFGHTNIELPSGIVINCSIVADLVGCLPSYPYKPDATVELNLDPDNLVKVIEYASKPMSWLFLYDRNCIGALSIALSGRDDRLDLVKELADRAIKTI